MTRIARQALTVALIAAMVLNGGARPVASTSETSQVA